ncbi:MAG: hypothetical protein ACI4A5_04295 [Hominilimicola sp.]
MPMKILKRKEGVAMSGKNKEMILYKNNRVAIKRDVCHMGGILQNPGDKLEARITPSNRKVVKVSKNNGKTKYSATLYPNGTFVEATVTRRSP